MTDVQGGLGVGQSRACRHALKNFPASAGSQRVVADTSNKTGSSPFKAILASAAVIMDSRGPIEETLTMMANLQSQFAPYVYGDSLPGMQRRTMPTKRAEQAKPRPKR